MSFDWKVEKNRWAGSTDAQTTRATNVTTMGHKVMWGAWSFWCTYILLRADAFYISGAPLLTQLSYLFHLGSYSKLNILWRLT